MAAVDVYCYPPVGCGLCRASSYDGWLCWDECDVWDVGLRDTMRGNHPPVWEFSVSRRGFVMPSWTVTGYGMRLSS